MILKIDINYSISLESKKIQEIRKEFNDFVKQNNLNLDESNVWLYLDKCPAAKNFAELSSREFEFRIYEQIYKGLNS